MCVPGGWIRMLARKSWVVLGRATMALVPGRINPLIVSSDQVKCSFSEPVRADVFFNRILALTRPFFIVTWFNNCWKREKNWNKPNLFFNLSIQFHFFFFIYCLSPGSAAVGRWRRSLKFECRLKLVQIRNIGHMTIMPTNTGTQLIPRYAIVTLDGSVMLVDDDPDKKPVDSIMWNLQVPYSLR